MDSTYMMIQTIIVIFVMLSAFAIPCYLYHQKMSKKIEEEERKKL
jgi:hypothetical protein